MKPSPARSITLQQARQWLPRRASGVNKNDCGRVLVVAGSAGMHGAGILATTGALRAGAGLVRWATVGPLSGAQNVPPEAMVTILPGGHGTGFTDPSLAAAVHAVQSFKPDVLAVGPGLGAGPAVEKFLRVLTSLFEIPLVVDADALNALAASARPLKPTLPAIFTPHAGEIARLVRTASRAVQENRLGAVRKAAKDHGVVCLLKGEGTLISDGNAVWKNTTGNPGMASGGMGDVLTGLIAGFWAQMKEKSPASALKAAAFGAFVHGLAADIAVTDLTVYGLLATDVLAALPAALKKIAGKNGRT